MLWKEIFLVPYQQKVDVVPWCSGYLYWTTSFNKAWTQVLRRFKSCSRRVPDSRWWGSQWCWQCSRLEIKLNAFRWSTLPQKQFIIINNPRFCKFFLYFFNSCLSISFTCAMQIVNIIRIVCSWRKVLNFWTSSSFHSYCYLIFFEVRLAFTIDTSWLVSFWLVK